MTLRKHCATYSENTMLEGAHATALIHLFQPFILDKKLESYHIDEEHKKEGHDWLALKENYLVSQFSKFITFISQGALSDVCLV